MVLRVLLFLWMVLACASTATGQVAVLDFSNAADGRYFYQIVKDGDSLVAVPISNVVRPGDPDDPDDPDEPAPDPDTVDKLVEAETRKVGDPDNAMQLAAAYQSTAFLISRGAFPTIEKLAEFQRTLNTQLLADSENLSGWSSWSDAVSAILSAIEGELGQEVAKYEPVWREIAKGLQQGAS